MLLDAPIHLSPSTFALGPLPTGDPTTLQVAGAMLIVAPQANAAGAESALKSLRGFRGAVRRAVWWNTTELSKAAGVDLRAWGRRLVEEFGAALVVVCGAGGREVALGARDAGLALGRVVVCRDEATARNVLGDALESPILVRFHRWSSSIAGSYVDRPPWGWSMRDASPGGFWVSRSRALLHDEIYV